MQFSLGTSAQVRPGYSPAMSDSSQQSDQKPQSKYAKAKIRKELKVKEKEQETLRIKKIQEEERLRRLQQGGPVVANTQAQSSSQVAQSLSMPTMPQPHPKLLESKQQGVQTVPAVKQEPQVDQHAGTALQKVPGAPPSQVGQVVLALKSLNIASIWYNTSVSKHFIFEHFQKALFVFPYASRPPYKMSNYLIWRSDHKIHV